MWKSLSKNFLANFFAFNVSHAKIGDIKWIATTIYITFYALDGSLLRRRLKRLKREESEDEKFNFPEKMPWYITEKIQNLFLARSCA